ncbi:methyltransferase domain-containing protein [Leptolyngbya sp. CCNP1308]|uniref:methyltransferase domain-containing protein n=1 Tax=Leptolyngbya sp. CCNP1308 TaxID=3110255 RepID=UPI002B1F4EAA|nr:methyltransferase domain-containing protein [Leptolyngbya sp. CCNP1308]MEA5448426.1 methyltransferase domain-containing protein [Leptolyngbya sp. CCNP1308]
MPTQAICTIVTKSHLCYARTLAESVRQHHPEISVYVLLADRVDKYFDPEKEPFELIQLANLPEQDILQQMCFYYTSFELCCALRAWLHDYLWHHTTVEKWLFLDGDIFVTHRLDSIFEQLDRHSVLINPHYQSWQALSSEDSLPEVILRLGIYNGGFLGVRRCEESAQFIIWFKGCLQHHCFNDLSTDNPRGLYVDQRWLDFLPALFPNTGLLRHPGANLGHWNLWEHPLCLEEDGKVTVDAKPLLFLHFSGWQIENPRQVSRNSSRYYHQSLPVWEQLADKYRERLLQHGYQTTSMLPYAFNHFSTDELIQPTMRDAYYEDLVEGNFKGSNPFEMAPQFYSRSYSVKKSVADLQIELANQQKIQDRLLQQITYLQQQMNKHIQPVEISINDKDNSKVGYLQKAWHQLKSKSKAWMQALPLVSRPIEPVLSKASASTPLQHDQLYTHIREPKVNQAVSTTNNEACEISQRLRSLEISVKELSLDKTDYQIYFRSARYIEDFPAYYSFNLPEKSLEHYIAAKLLQLNAEDTYIDIASEGSPVPEIYHNLFGSKTYRQDLAYPTGLHGNKIGGNAAHMPIPDNFASKMALHCSFEHFEQNADIGFVREAARVLRPGGKICIVPLYLALQYSIQTDPVIAVPQNVSFENDAIIHAAVGWGNRHGRFYDPDHLVSRISENLNGLSLTVYHILNAKSIDSSCYVQFAAILEKV